MSALNVAERGDRRKPCLKTFPEPHNPIRRPSIASAMSILPRALALRGAEDRYLILSAPPVLRERDYLRLSIQPPRTIGENSAKTNADREISINSPKNPPLQFVRFRTVERSLKRRREGPR